MKNLIFKYRRVSKAVILFILFVFSFSTIAADSYNCICKNKQEVKKEIKCCSVKKETKCCNSEKSCCSGGNKCGVPGSKSDCTKCTVKKSDIENPISSNDSKTVKKVNINLTAETISFHPVSKGPIAFSTWRPPDKTSRIYITLSNFRI